MFDNLINNMSIVEVRTHWSGDDSSGKDKRYANGQISIIIINQKYLGGTYIETKKTKNEYGTCVEGYSAHCYELPFKLVYGQEIYVLFSPFNKDNYHVIAFYETFEKAKQDWQKATSSYNTASNSFELYKYQVDDYFLIKVKLMETLMTEEKKQNDEIQKDLANKGPIWKKRQIESLEKQLTILQTKIAEYQNEYTKLNRQLTELKV